MVTNKIENYKTLELIEKDIKFITKSIIRIKILKCLEQSPLSIKEIVETTGICYSSISTNLNKLEEQSYILKKDNKFKTTPITSIYLNNILELNESIDLIDRFKQLWNQHNIEYLDQKAINDLILISNSELVESTPTDIYKTHNLLKEQLLNSKRIKLIFPYLHPEYANLLENSIKNNAEIDMVIDDEIYDELYYEISREERKKDSFNVYSTKKRPNIYLTICDENMSLGLFKTDGSFDQNRILISNNEKAWNWANGLFERIKDKTMEGVL